jgi:hypothetical protein
LEKVKKLEEIKKNIEQKEEEWLVINTK